MYCDGRNPVSITEFSPGMGIIQTDKSTDPYTILGRDDDRRSSSSSIKPLKELDPLPSYRDEPYSSSYGSSSGSSTFGSSAYGDTTFKQREKIRQSGRIPW